MIKDRREKAVLGAPERRYDDAKAASASAADRIAKATQECIQALRSCCIEEKKPEPIRRVV